MRVTSDWRAANASFRLIAPSRSDEIGVSLPVHAREKVADFIEKQIVARESMYSTDPCRPHSCTQPPVEQVQRDAAILANHVTCAHCRPPQIVECTVASRIGSPGPYSICVTTKSSTSTSRLVRRPPGR